MKSYKEYRIMQPKEYEKDIHWLANRLMYLWRMCDIDPTRYSVLKLYEEEAFLRTIKDLDTIAFSRHMDAAYDREIHRWKENYFDLTDNNKQL